MTRARPRCRDGAARAVLCSLWRADDQGQVGRPRRQLDGAGVAAVGELPTLHWRAERSQPLAAATAIGERAHTPLILQRGSSETCYDIVSSSRWNLFKNDFVPVCVHPVLELVHVGECLADQGAFVEVAMASLNAAMARERRDQPVVNARARSPQSQPGREWRGVGRCED